MDGGSLQKLECWGQVSTEQLGFSHSEMSRDEEPGAAQLVAELYEWVCAGLGEESWIISTLVETLRSD